MVEFFDCLVGKTCFLREKIMGFEFDPKRLPFFIIYFQNLNAIQNDITVCYVAYW